MRGTTGALPNKRIACRQAGYVNPTCPAVTFSFCTTLYDEDVKRAVLGV
jgi:hypothetical protein